MRRRLVAALAISATLAVLAAGSSSAGTGDPVPHEDGSWEMCGQHICFTLFEQAFYDYTINQTVDGMTSSFTVFDTVDLSSFQIVGNPSQVDGRYLIEGVASTTQAYDVPTGIMSFRTHEVKSVSFQMSGLMGGIFSEKSAEIGYGDFRGDLVLRGQGAISWNDREIGLQMQPGDEYYFRARYMYAGSLGPDIADGKIAGELYLDKVGENLISSVVDYEPIDMEVLFSSESELEVTTEASFEDGKTVIMTLDNSVLDVPLEDMKVQLDGVTLEMADSVKDVISSDQGSYYPLQNGESTQLFVYIPHFSQRTITISKIGPEEIGMDVYLGAFGSVLIVAAAATYLFKRKD